MTTIGIAISTRNRPEHLKLCLPYFIAYAPGHCKYSIAVCDDNSDGEISEINRQVCLDWGVDYYHHKTRLGVAANKNFGLSLMRDCDFVFLFDDDSFPNDNEWEVPYLATHNTCGLNHLTYSPWMSSERTTRNPVYIHEWGMGCCMFFSRLLIETIGGFDEKYHLFGFEHLSYGRRAYQASMNKDYGAYLTPIAAIDKIFTLDYEHKIVCKQPSLSQIEFAHIRNSYLDIAPGVIKRNEKLFDENNDALYVALPQYNL